MIWTEMELGENSKGEMNRNKSLFAYVHVLNTPKDDGYVLGETHF